MDHDDGNILGTTGDVGVEAGDIVFSAGGLAIPAKAGLATGRHCKPIEEDIEDSA